MAKKTVEKKGLDSLIPRKDAVDYSLNDEEMRQVLKSLDELLGKLPEDIIEEFSKSDSFRLYEKLMKKYKIK